MFQPAAVVLEYLLMQVSSISCNVVGSILALHAWKTLTHQLLATGGRGWGTPSLELLTVQKSYNWGA